MSARRYIHPEGLPSDYTITLLFRLLPHTPQEPFALWEILDKDKEPLVGVILDSESPQMCVCLHRFLTSSILHHLLTVHTPTVSGSGVKMLCACVPADGGKTLTFFNNNYRGEFQTVTFDGPEIRKLFYGSFHKVRIRPVC